MQSAKTLQQFGLDQFGIQLIKPHNSFASKVKRFESGLSAQTADTVPGPGQYYKPEDWKAKRT
jgi:NADH:ubiquinone oxidoreductase subunit 3 (subunit A)